MSTWLGLQEMAAADVPNPPAGKVRFFLDEADGVPSFKDSSGTVTKITSADPELAAIASLVSAADRLPYFDGSGSAALAVFTAAARSLLDDASVSAMVDTLGGAAATGAGGLVRATNPTLAGATFSADPTIPDEAYDATSWNGSLEPPTKNAVRDKIEDILDGVTFTGDVVVPDEAYDATGWNGNNEAPTKNAIRDIIETIAPGAVAPVQARIIAIGDETTVITAGVAKVTFRMPHGATLVGLPRASLTTASSSGAVTIDINEGGVSIFSTTLTIDQGEKTSTTAATPAVVSDTALADDAEITIDIDGAGTGAVGLKVTLYWRPT